MWELTLIGKPSDIAYFLELKDYLKSNLDSSYIILGPTMASMFKINNIYNILLYYYVNYNYSYIGISFCRYKVFVLPYTS